MFSALSVILGKVKSLSVLNRNREAIAAHQSAIGQFIFNRLGWINYTQRWLEHTNIDLGGQLWFCLSLRCAVKSYSMAVAEGQKVSISSKLTHVIKVIYYSCTGHFTVQVISMSFLERHMRLFLTLTNVLWMTKALMLNTWWTGYSSIGMNNMVHFCFLCYIFSRNCTLI